MNKIYGLKTIHLYLLLGFILTACSTSYEDKSAIIQVNYGTSFGMGVGYGNQDMILKSGLATYNCSGWSDDVQPITKIDELKAATWDSVNVNLSTNEFFDLPKRIGCPDCNNGGAEWIEIELSNGETHKVTFEYAKEPTFLKNYLAKIREIKALNDCE